VLSAVSREKRGSWRTSSITSGCRLTRTKPAGRKALADERVGPFAGDRFEDELVGFLVQEEDRRRLGLEDCPGHVDDRLQERLELLFRAEHAGGHGRPQVVAHLPPPTLFAAR
jgi:hypothetical protein